RRNGHRRGAATRRWHLPVFSMSTRSVGRARLRDAKEVADFCGEKLKLELRGSREQRMATLLQAAHVLTPHTNLAFARKRYSWARPRAVHEASARLTLPNTVDEIKREFGAQRVDLTHLHTFTIDDVSTQDMDDAISFERSRDGFSLGIHISDVASLLPLNSVLEQEALRRGTSIYAPERTANMLPDTLAENLFSLREGQLRLTMSCLIELNQRLEISKAAIVPSIIKVARRYNYAEVDEMLYKADSELHTLYNISSGLEAIRIENGAFRAGKREIIVGPSPDGGLRLVEIDENSPARSTVSELMVLANRVLADYGARHRLPLIYRGQTAPDPSEHSESAHDIPEGPAQDYSMRSRLKKSFTSVTPARHASLALDAYIQATSPIRRYADIVNQRQLLAHLAGQTPPHSAEDLEKIIEALSEPLAVAQSISKESKRFWLLRYIEHLQSKNELLTGVVLRTDLRHPLVEIRELVMPTLAKIEVPVKPGDVLQFRIQRVDARNDILRLEVVQKLSA
ncbi:MAG: RNB domain-containing ribonuclease, partial [Oligoflexia bacterium]|nr:RNB domain-containing ribonuclease [Oligoflexia bacterium]